MIHPLLSLEYISIDVAFCFRLLMQLLDIARSRACCSAGKRIAARIAMIAITTRSSISVNDVFFMLARSFFRLLEEELFMPGKTEESKRRGLPPMLPQLRITPFYSVLLRFGRKPFS